MIVAYLRERFPWSFFGPLALMLAGCAVGIGSPVHLATAAIGATFLLAQFRIWDDLADRQRDSTMHPNRVLVASRNSGPVVGVGIALLVVNVALATQRGAMPLPLLFLGILHAVLGCYYLLRDRRTVIGDQLLLSKYPAFVLILAGERLLSAPAAVLLSAAAVYAAASAYEAWHDPVSPLAQLLGGRS